MDLSDESVAGVYVGNLSAKIAALWEQLEGLWNAGDVDSASGVFLDRLASFVNVKREEAKHTQVTACVWGAEETNVPKETLAKISTTDDIFVLSKAIEITRTNLLGLDVKVSEIADFAITIGSATISVTAEIEDTGFFRLTALQRFLLMWKVHWKLNYLVLLLCLWQKKRAKSTRQAELLMLLCRMWRVLSQSQIMLQE